MKQNTTLVAFVVVVGILATANPSLAQDKREPRTVHPMLKALDKHRPVLKVVQKHYPEVTSITFGEKLHFEDSTRLYVARAVAKVPKGKTPPLVVVRGPKQKGGVWCDIILVKGSSKLYARSEGATEREHFTEHIIYQDLAETEHHLRVTLRVTKGEGNADFVKEFKSLIHSYSHDFATDK